MMGGTLPLVPGNVVAVTKAVAKAISKGDAIPWTFSPSPPSAAPLARALVVAFVHARRNVVHAVFAMDTFEAL
eukprot:8684195-Pyramimonas_sp.AAC.1